MLIFTSLQIFKGGGSDAPVNYSVKERSPGLGGVLAGLTSLHHPDTLDPHDVETILARLPQNEHQADASAHRSTNGF